MSDTNTQFPVGLIGEVSVEVTPGLTTRHLGRGAVPVFATPEMIRLMEQAAVEAVAGHLAPGQQTVGVVVNVRHAAPTPIGVTVTARAELVAVNGRRLRFHVQAYDGLDTIGEGEHERAVIDLQRFGDKASRKQAVLAGEPTPAADSASGGRPMEEPSVNQIGNHP